MAEKGYVCTRFIVFLKATLGKMVGTKLLHPDILNYSFWETWPKRFYNVKSYDNSKEPISTGCYLQEDQGQGQGQGQEQGQEQGQGQGQGPDRDYGEHEDEGQDPDSQDEIPPTQLPTLNITSRTMSGGRSINSTSNGDTRQSDRQVKIYSRL